MSTFNERIFKEDRRRLQTGILRHIPYKGPTFPMKLLAISLLGLVALVGYGLGYVISLFY